MDAVSYSLASKQAQRIESFIENPDSTSGIVTVPKTIASGETITIPAGRVAVLPNLVIDGILNIENGGEVFIPSGSTFGDLDAQLALKADTTYVNTQLSLKANTADLKEIGVNQTWQDLTASRVAGTTYTNSTGKPIMLSVNTTYSSSNTTILYVNGVSTQVNAIDQGYAHPTIVCIIPNGATYSITGWVAGKWSELR